MKIGPLLVTALFLVLGLSTYLTPDYSEWLALALMIGAGIPHGSYDLRVAKVKWRAAAISRTRTIAYYLICVFLMSSLCIFTPLLGLSLFLGISALHFTEGESLSDTSAGILRGLLFGSGAILLPIGLHLDQAAPYVSYFIPSALFNSSRSILGGTAWFFATAMGIVLIYDLATKRNASTVYERSLCLLAWILLPPLAGFSIWFIGRHSRQHLELCRSLFNSVGATIPIDFLVISLLAITGLTPFMLLFDFSDINQLFAASICLIAGLTLPHMIVSHDMRSILHPVRAANSPSRHTS
jgi:Brp/Blh family beta-carotene 15,15'-monooxygenase